MLIFNGNHPYGWVLKAERYFTFSGLALEEKIEATMVSLEGSETTHKKMGGHEKSGSPAIPTGASRLSCSGSGAKGDGVGISEKL